ncbi:LOW QUALITY PROTEIN: hypothetical protein V1478_016047, partial [Vespula squamosa]
MFEVLVSNLVRVARPVCRSTTTSEYLTLTDFTPAINLKSPISKERGLSSWINSNGEYHKETGAKKLIISSIDISYLRNKEYHQNAIHIKVSWGRSGLDRFIVLSFSPTPQGDTHAQIFRGFPISTLRARNMGPSVGGMETNTIRMEGELRPSSNLHPKLPDNIDPKHSLSLGSGRSHEVSKLKSPGYSTNQSSSQACRSRRLDNAFSSDNYADEAVGYDNAAEYLDLSSFTPVGYVRLLLPFKRRRSRRFDKSAGHLGAKSRDSYIREETERSRGGPPKTRTDAETISESILVRRT